MMIAVVLSIFAIAIVIGVPVAFSMGVAGAAWIILIEGIEPSLLVRRMYNAISSFPLVAIPLFIMIGHLAERCGLLPDLVSWLQNIFGRMRGGMAYINVLGSLAFSGVGGTAVSDVASLGRIEIGMMRRAGYPVPYAAALTAVSSILAPLVPPSVAMIIYALAVGNVSIGGLFMAGIVPALILAVGLLVMCWYNARTTRPATISGQPFELGPFFRQTLSVAPLLGLPVIIVGGIVTGVFTATESAAIGVGYVLLIGFVFTRSLKLNDVFEAILYSAKISSILGLLMGTGMILSWIFTRHQVTQHLAEAMLALTSDPTGFLAIVALTLLVLGMFLDETALIVAMAPLLAPVAAQYGIDPFQFGVVFVLSCMVGLIMPPIALILFMVSTIADVPLETMSRAILPFVAWTLMVIVIVILLPAVTVWLPRLVG